MLPGPNEKRVPKGVKIPAPPLRPPIPFPPPLVPPVPIPVLPPAAIGAGRFSFPFSDFVRDRVNSEEGEKVAKTFASRRASDNRSSPDFEKPDDNRRLRLLHDTVMSAAGVTAFNAAKAFSSAQVGGRPLGPTGELSSAARVAETLQARAAGQRRTKRSPRTVRAEGEGHLAPRGLSPQRNIIGGTSPGGEDSNSRQVVARRVAVSVAAAAGIGATLRAIKGGPPAGGGFHRPTDRFRPNQRRGGLATAF